MSCTVRWCSSQKAGDPVNVELSSLVAGCIETCKGGIFPRCGDGEEEGCRYRIF